MKGHMVRSTIVLSVYFQFQFTIPSGYPPADVRIRNWLLSRRHYNQEETAEWLRGFLYALLRVTLGRLKLEGRVIFYKHLDQNLTVRIPQSQTNLVCQNLTSLKFKNAIVHWRFIFAAA